MSKQLTTDELINLNPEEFPNLYELGIKRRNYEQQNQ